VIKNKKERNPNVFYKWRPDNAEQCAVNDFQYWKVDKFIKNKAEIAAVK
jgi:hypothetical protein